MKQTEAFNILKTGKNVFLTGEPGSGKTHTINRYIAYLRSCGVEPAVTASTGIAATHIGGYTIHSWSGIGIKSEITPYEMEALHEKKSLVNRINKANVLIVDEISMLDGKVLNSIDLILRMLRRDENPFGGMQIIFSGDFFQLPPISLRGERVFAFESSAWKSSKPVTCYIDEQFRQTDESMHRLLRAIRSGFLKDDHLWLLNERVQAEEGDLPNNTTKLFSHNFDVDRINQEELKKIDEDEEVFEMDSKGKKVLVDQIKRGCLSPEKLVLKKGAVVMCTKNNFEKGFANGTIGVIKSFEKKTRYPIIETKEGCKITVSEMEWAIEEEGKILAKVIQLPLRLAWAITVHKSQGVSLDSAIIDLSKSFEYGQGYVALSRVRTLKGLFCLGFNDMALRVHPSIAEIDRWFKRHSDAVGSRFLSLQNEKVSKMHKDFISSIGGGENKKKDKKGKISTYEKTKVLIPEVESIKYLAKKRGLTVDTVLNHLEVLVKSDSILREDLWRFWRDLGKTEKDLEEIHNVFESLKEIRLSPVFKKFKGKFSYHDIRLAKIFYLKL
jgi:ATP-dependent exoDNAse (exonuclease V) alpha subunit